LVDICWIKNSEDTGKSVARSDTLQSLDYYKYCISVSGVFSSLILFIVIIASANSIINYFGGVDSSEIITAVGVIGLLITGGLLTLFVIYFKAVLHMIRGIRNGILYNSFSPLPGIKVFSIITYIVVGFSVIAAFTGAVNPGLEHAFMSGFNSGLNSAMGDFSGFGFGESMSATVPHGLSALNSLFSLIENAGTVLFLIVLHRFNGKILSRAYSLPPQYRPQ